jgi:hypothetical protein
VVLLLQLASDWPEIIAAVGGVVSSCLTLYLAFRVRMSDRISAEHRAEEMAVHQALVDKLELEVAELKDAAKREP